MAETVSARVMTTNGIVTAEQLESLAKLAREYGDGTVLFTTRMTADVSQISAEKIDEFCTEVEASGMYVARKGSKVRPVVSCRGTRCRYGLIDTDELTEEFHHRFYEAYQGVKLPQKFKIAVGGCPNDCMKSVLHDLGIIGQHVMELDATVCRKCEVCGVKEKCPAGAVVRKEEKLPGIDRSVCSNCGRCEQLCLFGAMKVGLKGYRVYLGGQMGKQVVAGRELDMLVASREELVSLIEAVLHIFKEQGIEGERFSRMIERIGFEQIEAEIKRQISDELRREGQ